MDELVEFLRARLDEDERQQRHPFEQWHHKDCESLPQEDYPTFECNCGVPARVLRDVESDRTLIKEYEESESALGAAPDMWDVGRVEGLRVALELRAVRYADHQDYREEWHP